MLHMDPDRNIVYQRIAVHLRLSPYLTGMETSWRPVGDSSLRGSRRRRGLGGSRGSRGEINHVQFFRRLFGDFFKSPEGLGDVAATSRRLFCPRRGDVAATSPRRFRYPLGTKKTKETLRRRLRDSAATPWRLCGHVSMHRLTYFIDHAAGHMLRRFYCRCWRLLLPLLFRRIHLLFYDRIVIPLCHPRAAEARIKHLNLLMLMLIQLSREKWRKMTQTRNNIVGKMATKKLWPISGKTIRNSTTNLVINIKIYNTRGRLLKHSS